MRTHRTPSRSHTLDFYFDFSSPYSYLGATQAEAIAARTGAKLTVHPILLGAVFKAIGQADVPMSGYSPSKQRHTLLDMPRWAARWGVPFAFNSRFPINSVKALRAYLALQPSRRKSFRDAVYRAYWAEDLDITSDEVLSDFIGGDAPEVLARTQTKEIKDALFASTQRAIDLGAFGAPTWVVDGTELFFGQDRVPLIEDALRK
ncbi:MAG: 2-hydroxychromene-2-carboxylate isomerase [Polyangiales bacterium]